MLLRSSLFRLAASQRVNEMRVASTSSQETATCSEASRRLERSVENGDEAVKDPKIYQRTLWRQPKSPFTRVPQVWLSSLETIQEEKLSLIDLHPDIFRVTPRLDLLHRNIVWQSVYRNVQLTKQLSKAEMPGGGQKPWPQKKTGRAHVGSIRSPQFIRGGFANGVRGPRSWFYMLPDAIRLQGSRKS